MDVRIISATHCDLQQHVANHLFRADLFYRLGVLRVQIPALRERSEDIIPLAEWWLKNALAELGARPSVNLNAELQTCANVLNTWHWPGNVRELRNLMQRVALFLSVEPLQALTPSLLVKLAPELAKENPSLNTTPILNAYSIALMVTARKPRLIWALAERPCGAA